MKYKGKVIDVIYVNEETGYTVLTFDTDTDFFTAYTHGKGKARKSAKGIFGVNERLRNTTGKGSQKSPGKVCDIVARGRRDVGENDTAPLHLFQIKFVKAYAQTGDHFEVWEVGQEFCIHPDSRIGDEDFNIG